MPIKLEFSEGIKKALGRDAEIQRKRLEEKINKGLKKLTENKVESAADLYESEQTIRVVSFDEKEAKDAGLKKKDGPDPFGNYGETKGDFDNKGKPKKNGTAIIALDGDTLKVKGWSEKIDIVGSFFEILIHELLHATNKKRTHPPDDLELYRLWVKLFLVMLEAALKEERERKKKEKKKSAKIKKIVPKKTIREKIVKPKIRIKKTVKRLPVS